MITSISLGMIVTAGVQLYVSARIGITTYTIVKKKLMKNKSEDTSIELKEEVL